MKTIRFITSQRKNFLAVTLLLFVLMVACNRHPAIPKENNTGNTGSTERRQWLLEQFRGQPFREWPKAGMIDALGRLYLANGQDEEALEYISQASHDPSGGEFKYPYLARALYMFGDHFSEPQLESIKEAMTRKWAGDLRNHGTENHAAMRVTSQYLLAQYFPEATWEVGNGEVYSSDQMLAEAKDKILRRGRGFYRVGNNEQLSSTYFMNNTYPFLTLMEYAEDQQVRDAAEALVLYHISMVALNDFDGHLMPPFNRRNALQQRFGPPERITHRYMPTFLQFAWLFWGQNEVIPEDFTAANEPAYTLMFALSDWQMPEALNRIAKGTGVPYEIRGSLSQFGYNRGDLGHWGSAEKPETLRYVWRDREFSVGGVAAQYFGPWGFYLDYHTFGITWTSPHRFRSLEVMHPYWRSDVAGSAGGEDDWKTTHSPFQQTGVHRGTAIMLFDIPETDPWAGHGRADWEEQRDEHYERLIQLAQVRFPVTVDEVVEAGDFTFFREGKVYVAIRVLKSGFTRELRKDLELIRSDGYSDFFHVIKSREAQTGFVFEVGTADRHGSFKDFREAVQANPLEVNWNEMEVTYTNTDGEELRFRYDGDYSEDEQGYIWIAPKLWVNGQKRETSLSGWPVAESPNVSMKDGVLRVEQGGDGFMIDWSGELPKFEWY